MAVVPGRVVNVDGELEGRLALGVGGLDLVLAGVLPLGQRHVEAPVGQGDDSALRKGILDHGETGMSIYTLKKGFLSCRGANQGSFKVFFVYFLITLRVARFFMVQHTKTGKFYQMATKYIYQIA
jgi:hypothetical protein